MRKTGRKTIKKVLLRTDWFGVLTVAMWIGMGIYLWLRFWRIV